MISSLVFAASIASNPVRAAEVDEVVQAKIDSFLAAVIQGEELPKETGRDALIPAEIDAIANLAGCTPVLDEMSRFDWINILWDCGDNSSAERQTALIHEEGENFSISLNPKESRFGPTGRAQALAEVPSRTKIVQAFAAAIQKGNDASLDGLIPINPEQQARLVTLKGARAFRANIDSKTTELISWSLPADPNFSFFTELTFDDEGMPIGLTMLGRTFTKSVTNG